MSDADLLCLLNGIFVYMEEKVRQRVFAMAVLKTIEHDVLIAGMPAMREALDLQGLGDLINGEKAT